MSSPTTTTVPDKYGNKYFTDYHETCSSDPTSPGNMTYLSSNISINSEGFLQLQVAPRPDGTWTSSEAVLMKRLAYGHYWFTVDYTGAGGSKYFLQDNNTIVGVFSYKQNEKKTSGIGYCWPNDCHELDFIEWGKMGWQSPGPGDWGVQPWYVCNNNPQKPEDTCVCPDPNNPQSCYQTDTRNLVRLDDKDFDPISTKNCITYHVYWPDPESNQPIAFEAHPGDFGPQPWNGGFPLGKSLWSWKWPDQSGVARDLYYPRIDEDTFLHFNIWAMYGKPQNAAQVPSARTVVFKNLAFPPGVSDIGGVPCQAFPQCPQGAGNPDLPPCELIGKFCDQLGSFRATIGHNFDLLCRGRNTGCFDCAAARAMDLLRSYAANPSIVACSTACTNDLVCKLVSSMWDVLGSVRNDLDKGFSSVYNGPTGCPECRTDIPYTPLPKNLPPCNRNTACEHIGKAFDTLGSMQNEAGMKFKDLFGHVRCY